MKSDLIKLFKLVKQKKYAFFVIFLFFISSLLDLIGLGLIGPYIAIFLEKTSTTTLLILNFIKKYLFFFDPIICLGIIIILIFFIKLIMFYFINLLVTKFGNSEMVNLRDILITNYQEAKLLDFKKENKSEYIFNVLGLTSGFSKLVISLLKALGDSIMAIIIISFLFFKNFFGMFTITFLLIIIFFIYDKKFKKKLNMYGEKMNLISAKLYQIVNETMLGIKEIRILGKESFFSNKIKSNSIEWSNFSVRSIIIEVMPKYIVEFLFILLTIFFTLIILTSKKDLNEFIPIVVTFGVAGLRLFPISTSLFSNITTVRSHKNLIDRIYQAKSIPVDLRWKNIIYNKDLINFENLEMKNVYFAYGSQNKNIFENTNFKIKKNKIIGLYGKSGSGKSTLVELLTGMIEPDKGEILINGTNINTNLIKLRETISYLPQQIFIIDASIYENIALGIDKKFVDKVQILDAIEKAQLSEFVKELPDGLNTLIGDNGFNISGGQRQRIGIARMFYSNKQFLVLDEATNALDEMTENKIINEILELKKNKTILIISHNVNTLKVCDEIYEIREKSLKVIN